MEKFLSIDVLSWTANCSSSMIVDDPDWKRSYDYWQHADRLLVDNSGDHFRIDCISNLKRALDHRLKHLTYIYRFKQIPDPGKPPDLLETLAYFGVARPALIREINVIRNLLEHQYKSPPDASRCQELVDFAWYFLRSTDSLSAFVPTEITLKLADSFESTYWLEAQFSPETHWKCSLHGWIPSSSIVERESGSLAITDVQMETTEQVLQRNRESWGALGREGSDIWFFGKLKGPSSAIAALTRIYFSLL